MRTCPKCGKWKKPIYPLCWECNKPTWIELGESGIQNPWSTEQWKERRKQVIARTAKCERCGTPFTAEKPPVINHLRTSHALPDGKTDWDAYMAMKGDEVEVICNSCNWAFTRYRVYPGDPKITCGCGKPKSPGFKTCFDCYKKSPEHSQKQRERAEYAEEEARENAARSALQESADCAHHCRQVPYVSSGEEQINTLARCAAENLVSKYPQWFRIVTKDSVGDYGQGGDIGTAQAQG